ncbi:MULTISPECIES: LysR family transcriptional regulator [Pseudofrankia]|uniref:LysR family transcriptional regulator n=1 Tax=Pseudofrankia TaxID=2994363 RepID=UPI000234D10B|nr:MULTISPECIES: LysR family transcriptional regulator [Pseudofrankia]OHV27918.1 LysR family transcriptional regulator [Pseudofrankia sp. EUN1h]
MDTHRLRYFLHVADEGSINRAASTLGVAQPALSRQIRLLEEDLGVTLFRRTARGVQLTEDGERLRASTASPLRQLELAMRYVGSPLARIERGLHLGLPATAADILAMPLLDSLRLAFPKVSLRVTVATTAELVDEMLKGIIDIALIEPVPDGRLFYEDLVVEELIVVGSPTSDLNPNRAIEFADLTTLPLILPGSQTGIRVSLENTALRLKLKLLTSFGTDALPVAKGLIAAGHGYGVLPLSAVAAEIEAKRLRYAPLRKPTLTQQLGTAVTGHLEQPRGFAIKISEIIREEATRLIESGGWKAQIFPPGHGPQAHLTPQSAP